MQVRPSKKKAGTVVNAEDYRAYLNKMHVQPSVKSAAWTGSLVSGKKVLIIPKGFDQRVPGNLQNFISGNLLANSMRDQPTLVKYVPDDDSESSNIYASTLMNTASQGGLAFYLEQLCHLIKEVNRNAKATSNPSLKIDPTMVEAINNSRHESDRVRPGDVLNLVVKPGSDAHKMMQLDRLDPSAYDDATADSIREMLGVIPTERLSCDMSEVKFDIENKQVKVVHLFKKTTRYRCSPNLCAFYIAAESKNTDDIAEKLF